jgi:hypothetical protein
MASQELLKCCCNHCSENIEFPADGVGQEIECPHCRLKTTLYRPANQSPEALRPKAKTPPVIPKPAINPRLAICATCGTVAIPNEYGSGSGAIAACLWIFGFLLLVVYGLGLILLLIAFFYTLWRGMSVYSGCAHCRSKEIMSPQSPRGKILLQQYHPGQT